MFILYFMSHKYASATKYYWSWQRSVILLFFLSFLFIFNLCISTTRSSRTCAIPFVKRRKHNHIFCTREHGPLSSGLCGLWRWWTTDTYFFFVSVFPINSPSHSKFHLVALKNNNFLSTFSVEFFLYVCMTKFSFQNEKWNWKKEEKFETWKKRVIKFKCCFSLRCISHDFGQSKKRERDPLYVKLSIMTLKKRKKISQESEK